MLNIGDRVLQTTTTQGTGTISLDGTVTGFRPFVSGIGNGKKTVYLISDNTNWEVGIGTITDANPDTLSRTTILSSSNSGAAVNWGPGTRNVYCVMAAPVLPITDENLNFMQMFGTGGGTANAHTVTMPVTPLALSPDMQFFYRPAIANITAGFTINVDALGAKAAKVNGADPGIGFAGIGDMLLCAYKASNSTIEILNLSKLAELAYQGRNLTIGLNELMTTVASAATPDIWTNTGNIINYTGTTTTTGFAAAPQAGARRTLICAGAVQFTNGANLVIPGGANYTAATGDRIDVHAITTTQFRIYITKADGTPVVAPAVNIATSHVSAHRTGGNVTAPADYIFDTVLVNQGSHYNAATGVYTCPAAGVYQVTWAAMLSNTGETNLYKNGSIYSRLYTYLNQTTVTKTVNVVCAAGDTLKVRTDTGTGYGASGHSTGNNGLTITRLT